MTTKKPNRTKPRYFKICDLPRIAFNVFYDDTNVTNTDQILAVIAKAFKYTEIVSNKDKTTDPTAGSELEDMMTTALDYFYATFPELQDDSTLVLPPVPPSLTGDEVLDKIALNQYAVDSFAFVTITLDKGKVGSTIGWLIIISQLLKLGRDYIKNGNTKKCNCVKIDDVLKDNTFNCKGTLPKPNR